MRRMRSRHDSPKLHGHEINLDGGEISIIKAMGMHGTEVSGEELLGKLPGIVPAELIDTLKGLILVGYVEADRRSILRRTI